MVGPVVICSTFLDCCGTISRNKRETFAGKTAFCMEPVSPPPSSAAAGQVREGHGGHALRKAHGPAPSSSTAAATASGILDKVSTRVPAYSPYNQY